MDLMFWAPVMVGGVIAGASSGLLGVFIVGMRIPFLGVCVAHAALAGAVFGALAGLQGQTLLIPALAAAVLTALLLGLLNPQRVHLDDNVVLGFLFSATMGLAFVGIGLLGILGRSDNDVRSLLWGSLNFCRWRDVALMLTVTTVLVAFLLLFFKELRAIMFSRETATAAGIPAHAVWTGFLVLTAAVLTVNFQTVGGLMIYSLITNPAAAAFQLVKGCGRALALAALLGALSGLGGFLIAALTDLPSGAVIVLFSSGLVLLAAGIAAVKLPFTISRHRSLKMKPHDSHHHHDLRIGFFDNHAPRWEADAEANTRTLERLTALQSRLGLRPGMDVLEVGCGTGLVTGWLVNCVRPGRVLAMDFSPAMLAQAQVKGFAAEFRCLDICHETPKADAFDVAFCFHVFPHFRDQLAALHHLAAALRLGGRLLVLHLAGSTQINEFHQGIAGPVCHDRLPSCAEWPSLLSQSGFRRLSSEDAPDLFLLEAVRDSRKPGDASSHP